MLEPCEGKLSCTVLRGESGSNTADLLDQLLEQKQRFISQIMNGQTVERSCDDIDSTALSFAELKALSAGDPRIKEKMDLDVEVSRLKLLKANYESERYALEDDVYKHFPQRIRDKGGCVAKMEKDLETAEGNVFADNDEFVIKVDGTLYRDKKEGAERLLERVAAIDMGTDAPEHCGEYRGFRLKAAFNAIMKEYQIWLCGEREYKVSVGRDALGNIARLNNALLKIPEQIEMEKLEMQDLSDQIERGKEELQKPFEKEEELREKTERLIELNALLKMDEKMPEVAAEPGECGARGHQPEKEACWMER